MVKVGDRVRYLNAVGGGIVVRIAKDIAYVDEDGFETPVLARECVVVEPAEPAKKAASVPASKVVTIPSVEKAYAPEEDDKDSFAVEERPRRRKVEYSSCLYPRRKQTSQYDPLFLLFGK